jgi:hypothetical protein
MSTYYSTDYSSSTSTGSGKEILYQQLIKLIQSRAITKTTKIQCDSSGIEVFISSICRDWVMIKAPGNRGGLLTIERQGYDFWEFIPSENDLFSTTVRQIIKEVGILTKDEWVYFRQLLGSYI